MTETVPGAGGTLVDVVIPVLNEAHVLEKSVETLLAFFARGFPYAWRVVIADNGSTDGTGELASRLAEKQDRVRAIHLAQRGRGRALRRAWSESDAAVVCYMDVDLSSDLGALAPLVAAVADGGYDLATGSRLMRGSRTTRSLRRELISRCYNGLLKIALGVSFGDAQCGFKAVSRRVVEAILPLVEDENWFFDTEMLVLGERLGYRIKELPIAWLEDPDSRVKILRTAWDDIKGVARLRWTLADSAAKHARRSRPGQA